MGVGGWDIVAQETGESGCGVGLIYTVSVPHDDRVLNMGVGYD